MRALIALEKTRIARNIRVLIASTSPLQSHSLQRMPAQTDHVTDQVITDSKMPEMNSRDLTRSLRKRNKLHDIPMPNCTAAITLPLANMSMRHPTRKRCHTQQVADQRGYLRFD